MWVRKLIWMSLLLSLLYTCTNEKELGLIESYTLDKAVITTNVNSVKLNLTDFIDVKLTVQHPDDYMINLSMDKVYQKQFFLESFHKTQSVGTYPNEIISTYLFSFSALRSGKANLASFNIKAITPQDSLSLKTHVIPLTIHGVLNDKNINHTELQAINTRLSTPFNWLFVILPFILLIFYLGYRRKQQNTTQEINREPQIEDYILQLTALKNQDLDATSFDAEVKIILKQMAPIVTYRKLNELENSWNNYHQKQSYSLNQEERSRQEKLIHYIIEYPTIKDLTRTSQL